MIDMSTLEEFGQDPAHSALLSFDEFKSAKSTRAVCEVFKERQWPLSASVATTIGAMAKIFSLDTASLVHITAYVASFMSCYGLQTIDDTNSKSSIAAAFAKALASQHYSRLQLGQAFWTGIEEGQRSIDYWTPRRQRKHR